MLLFKDNLILSLALAFVSGFIPALFWLHFWLKEDDIHPEPKKLIFRAFIAGILATIISAPLELWARHALTPVLSECGYYLIFVWAFIEEAAKLICCFWLVSPKKYDVMPIDPVIFLITTALGFAALENTLYVFPFIYSNGLSMAFATANIRFIGASLLHVLASSTIGMAMSFSFFKRTLTRREALLGGIFLASLLHASFNFFILSGDTDSAGCSNGGGGGSFFSVLACVWIAIIILILILERIKLIKR